MILTNGKLKQSNNKKKKKTTWTFGLLAVWSSKDPGKILKKKQ